MGTIALATALQAAALFAGCDDEGEQGDTPETACCDLSEQPGEGGTLPCIEGASCCADGTWSCNEGDGSPTCDVCSAAAPAGETNLEDAKGAKDAKDAELEPPEAP
jgi:hypothetical protein